VRIVKIRRTVASAKLTRRFGARILRLRSERGWSMRDLSTASKGLSPSYICRVEAGKIEPGLGCVLSFASAFNLTPAELLAGL
jgi:transcriptional regulator with XRE-family HTH domain